jgi:hypothetical protein
MSKRVTKEQEQAILARLAHQEVLNFLMLFIIAEVVTDEQTQELLGAAHANLMGLNFPEPLIIAELDGLADLITNVRNAKKGTEKCSKLKN